MKALPKQEKQSQQASAQTDSASTVTPSTKQSNKEKVLNNLLKGFAGNTTPVDKNYISGFAKRYPRENRVLDLYTHLSHQKHVKNRVVLKIYKNKGGGFYLKTE